MENLIFSLNATVPVFLVIIAGYIFKKTGLLSDEFIKVANKFNFRVTLPVLLVQDLMNMNFRSEFDVKYIAYCFIVTCICITLVWGGAKLFIRDKSVIAEFIQGSFRGSAAVLGTAFVINIYGNTGMVPMMIIGAVPIYNIMSVIILELESPGNYEEGPKKEFDKNKLKKSLRGIVTNPILIGIFIGVTLSLLRVDFPTMVDNTLSNFAKMATPLALIAIGGTFETGKAIAKIKPALVGSFIKLVGQAAVFLPVAVALGFTDEKLMAAVIMLCSPTTPSCYVMAKGSGCDGILTSSMVVITTFLSAFTITAVIFVLRTIGAV
ncbi:MAG: AEC family transporter [Lachnospiraceae bacterium]|nr:AEC family transporter [Lachnospiraceae bacterium]